MISETGFRTRWFVGIVAAQVGIVVLLAAFHESALLAGARVRLKVVPVDPRSLFMGQYLALGYEAETINLNRVAHEGLDLANVKGEQVAVILREDGGVGHPLAVKNLPCPKQMPSGEFCLGAHALRLEDDTLRVQFYLDRYYVPEAKAADAERLLREAWAKNGVVLAEIATNERGGGQIVRILVEGEPLPF